MKELEHCGKRYHADSLLSSHCMRDCQELPWDNFHFVLFNLFIISHFIQKEIKSQFQKLLSVGKKPEL